MCALGAILPPVAAFRGDTYGLFGEDFRAVKFFVAQLHRAR